MHHECPKYPKTQENDQKWPQKVKTLEITKITLKPQKKKKNPLETSENDQNTHKLSQNTLDILDFAGILVDFKLHCSF